MLGYRIPKTWKKSDLAWAMFHAQGVESPYAIMGDYDKLLTLGFDYVRKNIGFNVDYTKYPTSSTVDLI